MTYKHMSLEERHYIDLSLKKKLSHADIAQHLDRSQTSISREAARNTGKRGYRYRQANRKANECHSTKRKAIKLTGEVTLLIEKYIKQDWSPEQVCG